MGTRIYKISKYKPSIFQGSLKFGSAHANFSLTAEHPLERKIFHVLTLSLFGLVCAYGYFVSTSVLNVIARKEAHAHTTSLKSEVSLLERDYYVATAAITPSAGERLGLAPVSNTLYVHPPSAVSTAVAESREI